MNKSWIAIATLLAFIAVSFAFNFSTTDAKAVTPVKWYSLEEAVALQKKKPKKIFIDMYTDWCGWCKLMQSNVFAKQAFIDWAKENVVLLELDFPKRTQQTAEIRTQNQNLQRALGVNGYPTVWLFVSKKNPETGAFKFSKIGKLAYPSGATKGEEEVKFLSEANEILAKNKS